MGKNGLSRKSKVRYGASRVPGGQVVKTKSLSLNTTKAQREAEKLQHNEQIAGTPLCHLCFKSVLTRFITI
jgi:hypothetical protein